MPTQVLAVPLPRLCEPTNCHSRLVTCSQAVTGWLPRSAERNATNAEAAALALPDAALPEPELPHPPITAAQASGAPHQTDESLLTFAR